MLADFFLRKYATKYQKENIRLSDDALSKLKEYNWHGNIRELQHTFEKVIILSDSNVLHATDFYIEIIYLLLQPSWESPARRYTAK